MHTSMLRRLAIVLVALAALGALRAEPAGGQRFTVTPAAISGINSVVASGGGLSSGGVYRLHGTSGQAATGISTGGAYTLGGRILARRRAAVGASAAGHPLRRARRATTSTIRRCSTCLMRSWSVSSVSPGRIGTSTRASTGPSSTAGVTR